MRKPEAAYRMTSRNSNLPTSTRIPTTTSISDRIAGFSAGNAPISWALEKSNWETKRTAHSGMSSWQATNGAKTATMARIEKCMLIEVVNRIENPQIRYAFRWFDRFQGLYYQKERFKKERGAAGRSLYISCLSGIHQRQVLVASDTPISTPDSPDPAGKLQARVQARKVKGTPAAGGLQKVLIQPTRRGFSIYWSVIEISESFLY